MRPWGLALLVFGCGCGRVKRDDEPPAPPPCDAYCDKFVNECHAFDDESQCHVLCECLHDGIVPEVNDEFIDCISELPCTAQSPEVICSLTVGGNVVPTTVARDGVDACEAKIDALGGTCLDPQGDEFNCDLAMILTDEVIAGTDPCFDYTTCDEFTTCLQTTLINQCLGF
jgi:hypothetical protein